MAACSTSPPTARYRRASCGASDTSARQKEPNLAGGAGTSCQHATARARAWAPAPRRGAGARALPVQAGPPALASPPRQPFHAGRPATASRAPACLRERAREGEEARGLTCTLPRRASACPRLQSWPAQSRWRCPAQTASTPAWTERRRRTPAASRLPSRCARRGPGPARWGRAHSGARCLRPPSGLAVLFSQPSPAVHGTQMICS